ncbi:MAG: PadR family transcriptional regulator [Actinomyces sp.]|uniref:PadR family transcriptional regulator n=1 Tax=Actinomyces sp. TaxID=29317 RepID=UPI0026DD2594|nr:PadR family transcriptional regulator [Actinomyces sp.]MDO4242205.1 PadR family transcriptional regulator [Actinomyces sp.]
MNVAAFPSTWLKGFLELGVLAVISRKETYGYEITRSLTEAGFGTVKGGTLYPILGRLEDAALVEAQWRTEGSGPGRKYYTLTDAGRAELAERTATWHSFAANLTDLLKDQS